MSRNHATRSDRKRAALPPVRKRPDRSLDPLTFDVETLEDRRLLAVISDGGFENNSVGQWYALGGDLVVSSQAARSGGSSALATNRTVDWNGIGRNLLGTLELDKDYKFTAYARLANAGSETVYFGVSQNDDRGTVYDTLRETTVTANAWTKLDGGFRYATVGNTTELAIYVSGPTPGVDFYIDDFTIEEYDWRADTNARIEQVRKSDATINVFDQFGNPLSDTVVELRQLTPSVELGSAFMPLEIDNSTYRDFFLDHFEHATVEALGHWSDQEGVRGQPDFSETDAVADFFRANGLKGHGHTIFFGDADTRPTWLDNITDQELFQEMIQRVNEVVTRYADVFGQWDVNNEMVKVQYFQDRLGDWIQAWMFTEARFRDPNAQLFLNEFSAIASGERIDDYTALIDDLLSRGAPVGAIGFQSHFNHTISSWDIQTSVDHFDDYGIPLYSTEFDVINPSDFERAKDLEVFFRTVMAMPEFAGVTIWGFWEGSHWRGPDASLFELDWSPNSAGQMYLDLWNEWTTELTGSTGTDHRFDFRGFHGDYEVLISRSGSPTQRHTLSLDPNSPQATFDFVLPTQAAHEGALASSQIQVRAAGSTGTETMQLLIDNQVVRTWTNIRGSAEDRRFIIRNYTHDEAVTADRIRVAFVNDGFENGQNRDLTVNQIRLGGVIHETESGGVLSLGSWANGDCDLGYKQSETLHCNGYFQFGGTAIDVFAAGATGQELIELQVRGETVAQFQVTGGDFSNGSNYQQFSYIVGNAVTPDEVRVAFVNDGATSGGADRNVRVDKIRINGMEYESEAAGTLSLGAWDGVDCGLGYRQSETLFCGGYFQYGHTVVEILAEGTTGEETMQLLIDGSVVQTWQDVSADFGGMRRQSYSYVHAGTLRPDQVSVAFVNDGTAANGADRNLRVDRVSLNQTVYESEAATTLSTGSWDATTGCAPGFKQSEILNCNGSFTYGATAAVATQTVRLNEPPHNDDHAGTRFYVVDAHQDVAERFGVDRLAHSSQTLESQNRNARGVAADSTGANYWVVDRTGHVFVYAADGTIEGSWHADELRSPQGIATDGQHVWIVDSRLDQVVYFADAASVRAGELAATSRFDLSQSKRATGLTTDGEHLWVVDSSRNDTVYRYTTEGTFDGSWRLDKANSNPTGITIDPTNVGDVWVVDARRDAVFEYAAAALADSVLVEATGRWDVAGRNPQGIADPPPLAGALEFNEVGSTNAATFDKQSTALTIADLQAAATIRLLQSERSGLAWFDEFGSELEEVESIL